MSSLYKLCFVFNCQIHCINCFKYTSVSKYSCFVEIESLMTNFVIHNAGLDISIKVNMIQKIFLTKYKHVFLQDIYSYLQA